MMTNEEMLIAVYSEGATEKNVIAKLCERKLIAPDLEERGGDGEKTMMRKLRLAVRAWYESAKTPRKDLRILVLRDLDTHEKKTIDVICKSTADVIRTYDSSAQLLPHETYVNVFVLKTELASLQLVLHIASQPYLESFAKATIDDYVLKLALLETTAKALLQNKKEAGMQKNPKRDWQIDAPALQKKVIEEIPTLLSQNKIPALIEAKEYVRFYATLLQEHSSPATFAGKVLAHAEEKDIREVFAPLLASTQSFIE